MGTWEYRVMRRVVKMPDGKDDEFFGIFEVYYDEDGKTQGWTEAYAYPLGETLEELQDDVAHFMKALQLPVLDYHAAPESPLSEPAGER
jgi:hypothetical protein